MLSSCAIHYGKCKCWPANMTPNTLINSLLVLLSVSKECKCIFTTTSNCMSPNQDALYQMLNMLYITLKCEWLMLFLKKEPHLPCRVTPEKSHVRSVKQMEISGHLGWSYFAREQYGYESCSRWGNVCPTNCCIFNVQLYFVFSVLHIQQNS